MFHLKDRHPQTSDQSYEWHSVVESRFRMCEALRSIPSTKTKQRKTSLSWRPGSSSRVGKKKKTSLQFNKHLLSTHYMPGTVRDHYSEIVVSEKRAWQS
jgi:hypothetical protein